MGSTSKSGIDNRVVIHVGLISENEEGKLAIVRGSKVALRVGKDFGAPEVCEAAVKKHSGHDQFFCGDEDYILLYPDQKAVVKVPGSDENFTVAKYKQELAKPYSKVDLLVCKVPKLNVHWTFRGGGEGVRESRDLDVNAGHFEQIRNY